jgi:hypothetical protein
MGGGGADRGYDSESDEPGIAKSTPKATERVDADPEV